MLLYVGWVDPVYSVAGKNGNGSAKSSIVIALPTTNMRLGEPTLLTKSSSPFPPPKIDMALSPLQAETDPELDLELTSARRIRRAPVVLAVDDDAVGRPPQLSGAA